MQMEKRLLVALFDALAGEKKAAAAVVYPQLDPDAGAKRLDRVAGGELAIPSRLISFVLESASAQQWIDAQVGIAWRDPQAEWQRAVSEVRALVETGQALLERLEGADVSMLRAERRGPVRARPRPRRAETGS